MELYSFGPDEHRHRRPTDAPPLDPTKQYCLCHFETLLAEEDHQRGLRTDHWGLFLSTEHLAPDGSVHLSDVGRVHQLVDVDPRHLITTNLKHQIVDRANATLTERQTLRHPIAAVPGRLAAAVEAAIFRKSGPNEKWTDRDSTMVKNGRIWDCQDWTDEAVAEMRRDPLLNPGIVWLRTPHGDEDWVKYFRGKKGTRLVWE